MSVPAAPPYAHLLKRSPTQARSRERVDAILDATASLLEEGDLERVTVRAVADAAGVPTGTIYQFFADKQTVLQALSLRYVAATHETLRTALASSGGGDWRIAVEAVVDGFAEMVRSAPAMRILWLSDAMDASTLSLADHADDEIATRLAAELRSRAGVVGERDETVGWRVLVGIISALLKQAFARDAAGDEAVLEEARRVSVLYAASLLGID